MAGGSGAPQERTFPTDTPSEGRAVGKKRKHLEHLAGPTARLLSPSLGWKERVGGPPALYDD